jgi:hypothetical protein
MSNNLPPAPVRSPEDRAKEKLTTDNIFGTLFWALDWHGNGVGPYLSRRLSSSLRVGANDLYM